MELYRCPDCNDVITVLGGQNSIGKEIQPYNVVCWCGLEFESRIFDYPIFVTEWNKFCIDKYCNHLDRWLKERDLQFNEEICKKIIDTYCKKSIKL